MADEMLKNAQPQELESQIGEEDGLKEQLLRMCRQNKLAAHVPPEQAGRLFGCADSGGHPDSYFCSRSGPLW